MFLQLVPTNTLRGSSSQAASSAVALLTEILRTSPEQDAILIDYPSRRRRNDGGDSSVNAAGVADIDPLQVED